MTGNRAANTSTTRKSSTAMTEPMPNSFRGTFQPTPESKFQAAFNGHYFQVCFGVDFPIEKDLLVHIYTPVEVPRKFDAPRRTRCLFTRAIIRRVSRKTVAINTMPVIQSRLKKEIRIEVSDRLFAARSNRSISVKMARVTILTSNARISALLPRCYRVETK